MGVSRNVFTFHNFVEAEKPTERNETPLTKKNGGQMINKMKPVITTKRVLLEQVDNMFDGIDGDIADVFKIAINNAINKTAHDINYDIINKGAFVGFGGKK